MPRLLQTSSPNIELKGYSKSSALRLTNLHPQLYVLFKVHTSFPQIDSRPAGEFIVIPENGILAPN